MDLRCDCGGKFEKVSGVTEESVACTAWKCSKCGEEILDMKQAKQLAKALENVYHTTISKWGKAVAIRIPARVVRQQHLRIGQKAHVIPEAEGNGFRVVPE